MIGFGVDFVRGRFFFVSLEGALFLATAFILLVKGARPSCTVLKMSRRLRIVRGNVIGKQVISAGKRTIVKTGMGLGKDGRKAVASISKGFSLRGMSRSVLVMSCVNFRRRRITVGKQGCMGIVLGRGSRLLSRIIMIKCNTRGGIGLAKTITDLSIGRLRDQPVADTSRDLTNGVTNMRVTRSSNVTNTSNTRVAVHKLNALGGASPLVLVSKIVSPGVSMMGPTSVRDVSILGSTTSTSVCNSRTTGNIMLIDAGGKGTRKGSAFGMDANLS